MCSAQPHQYEKKIRAAGFNLIGGMLVVVGPGLYIACPDKYLYRGFAVWVALILIGFFMVWVADRENF